MHYHNSNYSLIDRNGQRKYLNQKERKSFFSSLNLLERDMKLFCLMLFWSGARISEVLNLKKESIDLIESTVILESLKKRRKGVYRQVPLPPRYITKLKVLLKERECKAKIWSFSRRTANRHIKKVMRHAKIGGSKACPKGLRHSFAIHCLINKIPLTLIKKWLGHSSLTTTSIYLDVANEEEAIFARMIW